jgi:hypothetical protein
MNQQAPPDGNTTTGPKALAIISIVFAMAIMFYSLRIYTRLRPANKLDISDYFISGAVVSRNMGTMENKLQANCSKRLQKSSFSLRWWQQLPKGSDVTTIT